MGNIKEIEIKNQIQKIREYFEQIAQDWRKDFIAIVEKTGNIKKQVQEAKNKSIEMRRLIEEEFVELNDFFKNLESDINDVEKILRNVKNSQNNF